MNFGVIDSTIHGDVTINFRAPLQWPHRVGLIPPLVDCRQSRPVDHDLVRLRGGTVVACQVLVGLGGVGKTQLAAGLAHQVWEARAVDLLVWATASSRTGVLTAFAQAGSDVTGTDDPDPQQAAVRFLEWLARTPRSWLIVLDDVTDPNDLDGLWPPACATGGTVLTTRRRDAALLAGRKVVEVGIFTSIEAVQYLHDKLTDDSDGLVQAADLAADLGHLPLALAQAAAYMLDLALGCVDYRRRFADRRRTLTGLAPNALPDGHLNPVAVTWSLSIDLADRLAPPGLARPVLQIAALLDPNAIPITLFATRAVTEYCSGRLDRIVDRDDTHDALHLLRQVSLAAIDGATGTVRVHALVQRAVRESTDAADRAELAAAAADALMEIWPDPERNHALGQALRANTTALRAAGESDLWSDRSGCHAVLFRAGRSLGEAGMARPAINYFYDLHTAVAHLGLDHRDTLTARHNLAYWWGQAGDPAGAAASFEALLTDRVRIAGVDHPDTLDTRYNLAYSRGQAGDPAGAAAAFRALHADRQRLLGPYHPETMNTRHKLAYWQGQAGDANGAATAFEALLIDRLRTLGPDHPDTLDTRHNLAYWWGQAGDPAGAAVALESLLADRLRILGPEHPDTLNTRHNLAYSRGQAGDPASAAAEFEALLDDFRQVLGPDHPDTITAGRNLAYWRRRAEA